jgi:3' terminal RNA ribose 2'-O-methyltransferase Hen1
VLLTVTTTHQPAGDLGYLLAKHPDRVHPFPLPWGQATVFFPEATEQRCTAALLLDVDPIGLVRSRGRGNDSFMLGQYVNDRPYVAGSLFAVALGRAYSSALKGRSKDRPELVETAIPLELRLPTAPARGGPDLVERLFKPVGWDVTATPIPFDDSVPEWEASPYVDLRLTGTLRLADALSHLYVLLPVLDDAKHYPVSADEADKLLAAGEGWLGAHPERDLITRRYLRHRGALTRTTLARLAEADDAAEDTFDDAVPADESPADGLLADAPMTLRDKRKDAVLAALRDVGARRVLDLGCGDGTLLLALVIERSFTEIVGVDVSVRALTIAARRLHLDTASERERDRVKLLHGALTYTDTRLAGYDAAVLMEVVEHVDPGRLPALERAVFGVAGPAAVIVTTPNAEHNVRYEGLQPGALRHPDHRFEWSRQEFADWAERVAAEHRYEVGFHPVGDDDPEVGPPTQMAVFTR